MLILSRKQNEAVRIGDAVIRIGRIKGNSVRIAIEAPRSTRIVRCELERKDAEETDGTTGTDAFIELGNTQR